MIVYEEALNTRKRVFRNIENFILVFEASSHIWGSGCGM
jgi:hypothetical protein